MKSSHKISVLLILPIVLTSLGMISVAAQDSQQGEGLDRRVRDFLDRNRRAWRDMNVPMADGQKLYDLIVENGYTRAVEVGTSTGHSAIWIAWALSKTGGRLITVEIDERRYRQAVANFEEAVKLNRSNKWIQKMYEAYREAFPPGGEGRDPSASGGS